MNLRSCGSRCSRCLQPSRQQRRRRRQRQQRRPSPAARLCHPCPARVRPSDFATLPLLQLFIWWLLVLLATAFGTLPDLTSLCQASPHCLDNCPPTDSFGAFFSPSGLLREARASFPSQRSGLCHFTCVNAVAAAAQVLVFGVHAREEGMGHREPCTNITGNGDGGDRRLAGCKHWQLQTRRSRKGVVVESGDDIAVALIAVSLKAALGQSLCGIAVPSIETAHGVHCGWWAGRGERARCSLPAGGCCVISS